MSEQAIFSKQSDKPMRLKSSIKMYFPFSGVSGIHVAPVRVVSSQARNIKNQKIQGHQETAGPVRLPPGRRHRQLRLSSGPALRPPGETSENGKKRLPVLNF